MTGLKFAHQTRARHDGGSEARTDHACAGNPWPYDVLIDRKGGPEYHAAMRIAKDTCGGCPLFRDCFTRNADEPWVRAMLGKPRRDPEPEPATTGAGEALRRGWAERNAARLADIRDLMDTGAGVDEICNRLGLTRSGLWKWMRNHARAEWDALIADSEYGNQHRTTKRGHISTRRQKKVA